MPTSNASSKPATPPTRPDTGLASLLRAIGLAAVQVSPEIVALRTNAGRRVG